MGLLLKYLKLVEDDAEVSNQIKPGSQIANPKDPKKEIKSVKRVSSDGKTAVTDDGKTTPVEGNLVIADAESAKKEDEDKIKNAEKASELAKKATMTASRTYPTKALESQLNRLKVLSGIR